MYKYKYIHIYIYMYIYISSTFPQKRGRSHQTDENV